MIDGCPAQELYLEHNRLRQLPSDLATLTQLRRLYLDFNPDLEVPEAVEQLACMQHSLEYSGLAHVGAGGVAGGVGAGGGASGVGGRLGPARDARTSFQREAATWK